MYVYLCTYVYLCMYVCRYVCMYVCARKYIHIYIYIDTLMRSAFRQTHGFLHNMQEGLTWWNKPSSNTSQIQLTKTLQASTNTKGRLPASTKQDTSWMTSCAEPDLQQAISTNILWPNASDRSTSNWSMQRSETTKEAVSILNTVHHKCEIAKGKEMKRNRTNKLGTRIT